jgi:hypothetical protein
MPMLQGYSHAKDSDNRLPDVQQFTLCTLRGAMSDNESWVNNHFDGLQNCCTFRYFIDILGVNFRVF